MKFKLQVINLDFGYMKGTPETLKSRLMEVLLQVWKYINDHLFESMIHFMPNHIQALLN